MVYIFLKNPQSAQSARSAVCSLYGLCFNMTVFKSSENVHWKCKCAAQLKCIIKNY